MHSHKNTTSKKNYHHPVLMVYGDIRELTQNNNTVTPQQLDNHTGSAPVGGMNNKTGFSG